MSAAVEPPPGEKYVEFAEYVDFQLQKARRQIKATDLLTAATIAAVVAIGYVLVFVIADQWLVRGGLPVWVRAVGLVAWLGGLGAWLTVKILWPWIRTVSALFAAQEVERAEPALHSNLLNWVDLQRAGHKVDPQVLKAIEHRAAVQLSRIDVSQAVDHRPLLRAGYALLVVVCLFCLYVVFSPKKIAPSLVRLWPAAETPAPTRTVIREVRPGDAHVLARSWQEVTVDLGGVIPPQVRLLYTTADRKFENEPVSLQPDQEGSTRYRGLLSGENGQGLLQDLTYHIEAGDAVSPKFAITIEQPPSAKVLQVAVHPPEYTRLPTETFPGGNFTGLEGSRVELSAAANMPLKQAAVQFLDEPQGKPTGEEENAVVTDGTQIAAAWTLKLPDDGKYPRYFRIHCETPDGRRDPAPLVYQYTIRKDQPPEIVMISPDRDLAAPANAVIPLLADARDPDFELGPVTLLAERDGRTHRETLFTGGKKSVRVDHELALDQFALREGDELTISLEAQDNRQPRRNRKQTPPLRIRIEPPTTPQKVQDQLADARQKQKELAEAQTDSNPAEPPAEQPDREAASPRGDSERAPPAEPANRPPSDRPPRDDQNSPVREPNDANPSQVPRQSRTAGDGDRADGSNPAPADARADDERKLSPDGEDDQEVLRRLHEKLAQRGKSPEQNSSEQSGDAAGQRRSEKQPGNQQPADAPPQPGDNQPPAPEGQSEAPGTPNSKSDSRDAADGSSGKTGHPPGSSSPKPEPSSDAQSDAGRTASQGGTPKDRATSPNGQNKSAASERPNGAQNPAGSASGAKPTAKPGDNSPQHPGELPAGDNQSGKSPAGEARPQPGAQTPPKPQPDAEGQPMPAKDAPASASPEKPGAGNPQSAGSSKNAPKNDEPKAADSKPAAQPGDQKTASQQGQPGAGENAAKPMSADSSKPGQSGTEGSAPMPGENRPPMKNNVPADRTQDGATGKQPQQEGATEKRDGEPGGKDQPAQGTGRKDGQRSDQPQQGEAGGSQQSQTGNKGSQQRGPGESTGRPGEQEAGASSKTGESAKGQQPGAQAGQKSGMPESGGQQAGGKQTGGQQAGGEKSGSEPSSGKPGSSPKSGAQGQQTQSDQAPNASQQANDQGQPSKSGTQPGEQPSAKDGSATDDAQKSPKAGEPQQGTGGEKGAGGEKGQNAADQGQRDGGQQSPDGQNAKGTDSQGQSGAGQQPGKAGGQKDGSQTDGGQKGGDQAGGQQAGGEKAGGQQSGGDQSGGQQGGKQSSQGGAKSAGQKPGDGGSQAQGNEGAGGANGSGPPADSATVGNSDAESAPLGEAANLDYNRQAAELLLQRLRNNLERGEVESSLLKELGWTEDEMRRFVDRLGRELDRPTDDESPEAQARRLQFEEMLKSLDLQRTGAKRTGGRQPQRQVDQIDVRRTTAPAEYRKAWENYTRRLLEQKQPASK